MELVLGWPLRVLCRVVSTHAPLRQRGEQVRAVTSNPRTRFQPTPRFVSEANGRRHASVAQGLSFNPRPASSARRTPRPPRRLAPRTRFNPRPASSARRTGQAVGRDGQAAVSTHAPLRQRGEREAATYFRWTVNCFNPRPASSARRTRRESGEDHRVRVSTHAPLRQRGEQGAVR